MCLVFDTTVDFIVDVVVVSMSTTQLIIVIYTIFIV